MMAENDDGGVMPMLTPEDIASAIGVTVQTVYRWLNGGRLRGVKFGPRTWRIAPSEWQRFQKEGGQSK